MAEFGKFSEITFVNGGSPPIDADNLNELERVVALTDIELARSAALKFSEIKDYFHDRNTKVVTYMVYYTDWTIVNAVTTDLDEEADNQLIGNRTIKLIKLDNTADYCSIYRTYSPVIDLTTFNDGSASGVDDVIMICFYASDGAAWDSMQIRMGDDFANCYFYEITSISTGWNVVYPQKSDFATYAAPTGWHNIAYIRFAPLTTLNQSGEYLYLQAVHLNRQDPVYSGYGNAFQKYMGAVTGWENVFSVVQDYCCLYRDFQDFIEEIGFMKLDGEDAANELFLYPNVIEFISKFEFYCKEAGESASITWIIDANNYAEVYISSDTFYLDVTEAAATTSTNTALEVGLIKNERFYIYFEKEADTFRAILKKDGEPIIVLEYETSIASDSDGDITLGQSASNSFSFCTDFEIGNKVIGPFKNEIIPRFYMVFSSQALTNNTLTNVLNMVAYLPPMTKWKVELHLTCYSASAATDIKLAWASDNVTLQTLRNSIGPDRAVSDVYDTGVRISEYGLTSSVSYGCDGTANESYIQETMIIITEHLGGKLQLQAAQYTTDAGNPTYIKEGSYMIITPISGQAVPV